MRRWRTRYVFGLGELLRASIGQPRLNLVLHGLRELRIYLGVMAWWVILLGILFWPQPILTRLVCLAVMVLAPFILLSMYKSSLNKGLYSLVSWCFSTAGLVRGLLLRRHPATELISSCILREPNSLSSLPIKDIR